MHAGPRRCDRSAVRGEGDHDIRAVRDGGAVQHDALRRQEGTFTSNLPRCLWFSGLNLRDPLRLQFGPIALMLQLTTLGLIQGPLAPGQSQITREWMPEGYERSPSSNLPLLVI